jgi:sigma54-dependent transcription regulator
MNEKIRELLLNERNMFVNGVTESNNKIYIHGSEENLEKFAQLIVQKCADIGQRYADGNYEVPNQILEYFGVE